MVDEFHMCPEAVMRMPFRRFQAWQRLAWKRSVEARNRQIAADNAAQH